nr:MAG TPA: hypothetical protein [Microviridae sp.]
MERSDFLIGAPRSGILARRRAKASHSCLAVSIHLCIHPPVN